MSVTQLTTDYDKKPWLHYQAALKVARLLNQQKFDAYLIGGAVRDILLGYLPKDFDLVTNAKPEQILALAGLEKSKIADSAQAYGITRVQVTLENRGKQFAAMVEVATYRRDIEAHLGRKATKIEFADLETDVNRRDFTINGLALDLANDYLVDYVGGLSDLDAKLIRFIGTPAARIAEDPLRILRAVRLKAQLKFNYEPKTEAGLKAAIAGGQLVALAPERLREELSRLLLAKSRMTALSDLAALGALAKLLPELAATKGVPQPKQFHAEGDVWTHSLLALSYLPPAPSLRLVWATLLHDIGKAVTYQPAKGAERIRFNNHYEKGAELVAQIAKRLRFSNQLAADTSWLVRYHMGIDDLPKMRPSHRQAFLAHSAFTDLLALHKADAKATWHQDSNGQVDRNPPTFPVLDQLYREHQRLRAQPPPSLKNALGIDGNWLMQQFHLTAGPELGQLLNRLNEAYLDGGFKTVAEAKGLVDGWL